MEDAATLAMPDASGGYLWHPARLDDVYALPYRTWWLYLRYRAGMAERMGSEVQGNKAFGEIGGVPVMKVAGVQ